MESRSGSDQETTLTKVCTKCSENKSLDKFHSDKSAKDGRKQKCKPCNTAASREWYEANRESVSASGKVYRGANRERRLAYGRAYHEANRERSNEKRKAWRKANPDRNKAAIKAWEEANQERKRATDKAWYEANYERIIEQRRPRVRERKYGVTPETYDAMLADQVGRCAICGTDEPGGKNTCLSIDHDHATGVVRGLLCINCNHGIGALGDSVEGISKALEYLLRTFEVDQRDATTGAISDRQISDVSRYRRSKLKHNYNLTPEQYDVMLAAQEGKCACCGTDDPGRRSKNLYIDHCHTTDNIRGLLCHRCNMGIGKLGDNLEGVTKALEYLQRASGLPETEIEKSSVDSSTKSVLRCNHDL